MTDKKDDKTSKFEKVPQVTIDGEMYHESALVSFGFIKETKEKELGGNVTKTTNYSLVKNVVVRGKVANEKIIRTEPGNEGFLIIMEQLVIEARKEMKRLKEIK